LDPDVLMGLLEGWSNTPRPAAEWILTLPVATALARRGADRDRIERRGRDYQERVAEGYAAYVERVPHALALDADVDPDALAEELWRRTRALLER
jgi:thymidylate kinase